MKIWRYAPVALIAIVPNSVWAHAEITVSPDTNHPAGKIVVKGSGFQASESIEVRWDHKKQLFTVTSDASGSFSKQKTKVPTTAPPGEHTINANGVNGDSAKADIAVSTPWVEFGFSSTGGRYNPYENVVSRKNVRDLSRVWVAKEGSAIFEPVVANGAVYVAADVNNIAYTEAFDAATGHLLWSVEGGGSQAVAKGVIYVTGGTGVQALDAKTGAVLWTARVGCCDVTVADGIVYVGATTDDKLYALNAATGKLLWSAATGDQINSFPAVANGMVYVGSRDDKVYAFDASTGAKIWSATTGGFIYSSASVANGIVYIGSGDNKLYAFDAASGTKLWSATTGTHLYSSPAVANGTVFIGSWDTKLYAFDAKTGHLRWSSATGSAIETSPAVANGIVYVASHNGALYAFDAKKGKILWSQNNAGVGWADPIVSDGILYDGSQSGSAGGALYAFALKKH